MQNIWKHVLVVTQTLRNPDTPEKGPQAEDPTAPTPGELKRPRPCFGARDSGFGLVPFATFKLDLERWLYGFGLYFCGFLFKAFWAPSCIKLSFQLQP